MPINSAVILLRQKCFFFVARDIWTLNCSAFCQFSFKLVYSCFLNDAICIHVAQMVITQQMKTMCDWFLLSFILWVFILLLYMTVMHTWLGIVWKCSIPAPIWYLSFSTNTIIRFEDHKNVFLFYLTKAATLKHISVELHINCAQTLNTSNKMQSNICKIMI